VCLPLIALPEAPQAVRGQQLWKAALFTKPSQSTVIPSVWQSITSAGLTGVQEQVMFFHFVFLEDGLTILRTRHSTCQDSFSSDL